MIDPEKMRAAASRVESKWIRGDLTDYAGGVCLVGALNKAFTGNVNRGCGSEPLDQVSKQLRRYPLYRFLAWRSEMEADSAWVPIALWNDCPWRRKKTVLKVLTRAAKDVEGPWLKDRCNKLMIEVVNLRAECERLRERVARLKDENASYRWRIGDQRSRNEDKERLAQLDAELELKVGELVSLGRGA